MVSTHTLFTFSLFDQFTCCFSTVKLFKLKSFNCFKHLLWSSLLEQNLFNSIFKFFNPYSRALENGLPIRLNTTVFSQSSIIVLTGFGEATTLCKSALLSNKNSKIFMFYLCLLILFVLIAYTFSNCVHLYLVR